MKHLPKLILTISAAFLLSSCTDNKYAINVPSKYKGWIYLIASKGSKNGFNFYPDSNGVIYIPEYCKSERLLTLKIDGKEIPPTRVHFDNIFLATDSFKVTYKQFYFPLTSSDL